MASGIYSALSGMRAKQLELETVSHNLANASTNGFKEENISFAAVMGRNEAAGAPTPFATVNAQQRHFGPGTLMDTGNPLDLSIAGDAFFEVQSANGDAMYTRNGAFALNTQGELVTTNGERVLGQGGPLSVQGGTVAVASDGSIAVDGEVRGRLKLVKFATPQALQARGGTMFSATESAGATDGADSQVMQGRLESSNTNVVSNLVKLIEIARQYQTYQQVISEQTKLEQAAANSIARMG